MAEGREGPPHGLPSNDFLDDDQLTVSPEVATPTPALTEDMVEGALRNQPPDIERDPEPETTDLRIPPGMFDALYAIVVLLLDDIVQNLPLPLLAANICLDNSLSAFPTTLILPIPLIPSCRIRSQSLPVHLGGLSLATTLVAMHRIRQQ
jgi:hypothetical protein